MAKLNINFNNADYYIDESALTSAINDLKSHFSTVINGTGITFTFGGVEYSIDSAKFTIAMNDFVTHLGTIAGNGAEIVVDGITYKIDSTKLTNAVSELENTLRGLESGISYSTVALLIDGKEVISSDGFKIMLRGE